MGIIWKTEHKSNALQCGGSGIVPAALIAIVLNVILPKEEKQAK